MRERPVVAVILSALFFGLSAPLCKLLLKGLSPVVLAGFLYLGVFFALVLYSSARGSRTRKNAPNSAGTIDPPLNKRDLPWLAGAVLAGGIVGPISLMAGLARTTGFSASLLLNLEGAATALIAVVVFQEQAGRKLWLALGCMTLAGVFTAWDPARSRFSPEGPLFILLAMACWGLDNNLTRNISEKDPVQITKVKGLMAGAASLGLALALGREVPLDRRAVLALLVGAAGYGASLVLFIKALKGLGAFRTGALFSLAPFIGGVGSLVILRETPEWFMLPAVAFMALGVAIIIREKHGHRHKHVRMVHDHMHVHDDIHHAHVHSDEPRGPHSHEHAHEEMDHVHVHWPDTHHRHGH
jgi:drug/metabolite transporter (DMT)-like permease